MEVNGGRSFEYKAHREEKNAKKGKKKKKNKEKNSTRSLATKDSSRDSPILTEKVIGDLIIVKCKVITNEGTSGKINDAQYEPMHMKVENCVLRTAILSQMYLTRNS